MTMSATLAGDTSTGATWIGAVGTWAVGLVATWIAFMQYRHAQFRPAVWASRDGEGRVTVESSTRGRARESGQSWLQACWEASLFTGRGDRI